jgi:hypothetical protein
MCRSGYYEETELIMFPLKWHAPNDWVKIITSWHDQSIENFKQKVEELATKKGSPILGQCNNNSKFSHHVHINKLISFR